MQYKSDFLNEIYSRGFIYQSVDIEELDVIINKKKFVHILALILQVIVYT